MTWSQKLFFSNAENPNKTKRTENAHDVKYLKPLFGSTKEIVFCRANKLPHCAPSLIHCGHFLFSGLTHFTHLPASNANCFSLLRKAPGAKWHQKPWLSAFSSSFSFTWRVVTRQYVWSAFLASWELATRNRKVKTWVKLFNGTSCNWKLFNPMTLKLHLATRQKRKSVCENPRRNV